MPTHIAIQPKKQRLMDALKDTPYQRHNDYVALTPERLHIFKRKNIHLYTLHQQGEVICFNGTKNSYPILYTGTEQAWLTEWTHRLRTYQPSATFSHHIINKKTGFIETVVFDSKKGAIHLRYANYRTPIIEGAVSYCPV